MKIKPFEKMTVEALWNDEYISKQMLKYHIDGSNDIASRNESTIQKTVDFIHQNVLNNQKSDICDFGCGPGLYTGKLEQLGHNVTGVDFSTSSIKYTRSMNKNVDYIEDNYLNVRINKKFDLIIMIYCDFSVLSPIQVKTLLENMSYHLKPGGQLFFDVHSMYLYNLQDEFENTYTEKNGFYMEGLCEITQRNYKYKQEKLCLLHIKAKGKRIVELFNWYKCYSDSEITELLGENGFIIEEIYDNTYGGEDKKSDSFCVISKKKKAE